MGSMLTLVLLFVILIYAFVKADVLVNSKDVNVLSTINDMYYTPDDEFTFDNGFNIAAGFTAYDSNPEPILDPTIGEVVFNHFRWGPEPDGSYITERKRIPDHPCSREELGIEEDRSNSMFMPVYESSKGEVDFYWKKFQCVDKENLKIYGDYNSYKAS